MKNDELYDAITDVRDDLVEEAGRKKARSRRKYWIGAVAAVLVLALVGNLFPIRMGSSAPDNGSASGSGLMGLNAYAIAEAEYPEMSGYPDESKYEEFNDEFYQAYDAWWADRRAQKDQPEGYDRGYDAFVELSAQQILSGAEAENRVYSPLNVYMALAMLAEVTDGSSREQILDLLNAGNIDTLRSRANSLWNANYINDGATTSILASSLWLSGTMAFKQEAMDILASNYYASSYTGDMCDPAFTAALQQWLNSQTGGLLEEQAGNIELDANTIMALATTLYFSARWDSEFNSGKNTTGVFHAAAGDVEAEYMHKNGTNTYNWGEQFSAVRLSFTEGGSMSFILPDEGVSIDQLLADPELYDFLESGWSWEKSKYLIVNMAVPKFDVSSDLDLIEDLKALGVTDVFDMDQADFSPMSYDSGGYISQVKHAARVMIDEEGCTAAAFTVMARAGSSEPPDETVDFILDWPFLFVITSETGQTLFIGTVNQPNA